MKFVDEISDIREEIVKTRAVKDYFMKITPRKVNITEGFKNDRIVVSQTFEQKFPGQPSTYNVDW